MLCKAITAKELNYDKMMIPLQNLPEVSVVQGIEYFPVNTLNEAVAHFTGQGCIKPAERIEVGKAQRQHPDWIFQMSGAEPGKKSVGGGGQRWA